MRELMEKMKVKQSEMDKLKQEMDNRDMRHDELVEDKTQIEAELEHSKAWRQCKAGLQEVANEAAAALHQATVNEMKHKEAELKLYKSKLEAQGEKFATSVEQQQKKIDWLIDS